MRTDSVGEHDLGVGARAQHDALLALDGHEVGHVVHAVQQDHLGLGAVLQVQLQAVGVQPRVPRLPRARERPAQLLDVAVQDAVRL